MEKALALHEKVMKLLIRRYVTAEQRRRDDFGITEDDIIEVRQDISSLRFELLEIFQNNNYNVPDIEKKTAAAAGEYDTQYETHTDTRTDKKHRCTASAFVWPCSN